MYVLNNEIEKIVLETPALAWLKDAKKDQVVQTVNEYDFGLMTIGFVMAIRERPKSEVSLKDFLITSDMIAKNAPIAADPKKLAFFSGSAQKRAEEFVNENTDYNIIHTTLPGILLEMLELFDPELPLTRKQRYAPWNTLSSRLAYAAEHNTLGILDVPKPTATFVNYEMPIFLLKNEKLFNINDTPKQDFWQNLELDGLDAQGCIRHKQSILKNFNRKPS